MYEVFAHTADIGLRARAATLEELFCESATGLFALIVSNLDEVQAREEVQFTLTGRAAQYDFLLFDWLNELLYTFDSRRLVLSKFSVQLSSAGLQATAWGEPLDPARHQLEHEVKAITYHGLKVVSEGSSWLAEVIVDI
ncbi:MAG TPA: archease [Pirellulales bacterium]|jgi:SHS2 domain-containing protein|nr:archease [Pirellulales bacterium]